MDVEASDRAVMHWCSRKDNFGTEIVVSGAAVVAAYAMAGDSRFNGDSVACFEACDV